MPRTTEEMCAMRTKCAREAPFYQGFRRDNRAFVQKCFKTDWARVEKKVQRLIPPAEWDKVVDLLQSSYGSLLAIYRHHSSVNMRNNSEFFITQLEAREIMLGAGMANDAVTKNADIDRMFITANVVPHEERKRGSCIGVLGSGLVRHQFLEFIVRVAHQRFVGTGADIPMTEAIRK